jgi:hypothetical protein
MKRSILISTIFSAALFFVATAPLTTAIADNGNAGTTASFFSGGAGGHADWFVTDDQPPGDTDNQAIRLITTNGAPTFEHGYAGILFHHVTGIPAAAFPDSAFWNKTPYPYIFEPSTQGSPRLVVEFQTATGQYDGDAQLTENVRGNDWEMVSDMEFPEPNTTPGAFPNSGWDIRYNCHYVMNALVCAYAYHQPWSVAQALHAGDTILDAYIVADAYGIYHLIDDISVNGKRFSSARDNGNGKNDPAGPTATTDPSLLPPLPISLP